MSDTSAIPPGNGFLTWAWSLIAGTAGFVWFAVTRFASKTDLKLVSDAQEKFCSRAEVEAKFDALASRHDDLKKDVAHYAARTEDQFNRVYDVLDEIRNKVK